MNTLAPAFITAKVSVSTEESMLIAVFQRNTVLPVLFINENFTFLTGKRYFLQMKHALAAYTNLACALSDRHPSPRLPVPTARGFPSQWRQFFFKQSFKAKFSAILKTSTHFIRIFLRKTLQTVLQAAAVNPKCRDMLYARPHSPRDDPRCLQGLSRRFL